MSPRSKVLFAAVVFFLLSQLSVYADKNPVIKFYQDHISAVDGNRCPMHPSCSAYASQTFEKHGPIIGWIMTLDRLVRCGRDEAVVSKKYHSDNHAYIHDPVEANDFWWFTEKEKPHAK